MLTRDPKFPFLLTIAIPTFNRQESLLQCLNLLARALDGLRPPVELMVLNNASTDSTGEVVNAFQKSHFSGFEFVSVENASNIGLVANLLRAMELARGRFFMWLGDDDTLVREEFNELITILDSNRDTPAVFQASWPDWNVRREELPEDPVFAAMELFYFAGNSWATVVSTSTLQRLISDGNIVKLIGENWWAQTYLIYAVIFQSSPSKPLLFEGSYGRQIKWMNSNSKEYFIRSVSDLLEISVLLSNDYDVSIAAFHGKHTRSAVNRHVRSIVKYAMADLDRTAVTPVIAAATRAGFRLGVLSSSLLFLAKFPRVLRNGLKVLAFLFRGSRGLVDVDRKLRDGQSKSLGRAT